MSGSNQEQIDLWSGRIGEKWAAMEVNVSAMMAEVTAALTARAGSVAGLRILDIGCGNGETCSVWLAGGAEVTGVDVSPPMLAVAAKRTAGKVRLVEADASVWSRDTPFDLAVSQLGVMFFADPDAAFANIAANIRPGGRLLFACWRPMSKNEWVATPMDAIRDLLPDEPVPDPHAPGPFALADSDRTRGILERAGFTKITIDPADLTICLASAGGVEAAVNLVLQIGPSARALAEVSKETRGIAAERLKAALAPHAREDRVTLGGAIWLVEAVRPT